MCLRPGHEFLVLFGSGVPGEIRTHGPRIRNPVLYPAELRGLYHSVTRVDDHINSAVAARNVDWGVTAP
jgi:hypothetical protein